MGMAQIKEFTHDSACLVRTFKALDKKENPYTKGGLVADL